MAQKIIIILGATASGKTALAVQLAQKIGGEIISADSRQVFKNMDLGSGKDLTEYQNIPYHLIDILEAGTDFSVADFQKKTHQSLKQIVRKGKIPIICGGTAYYVKALIEDYQFGASPSNFKVTAQLEKKERSELYQKLKSQGIAEHRDWKEDSKRRIVRALEKVEQNNIIPKRVLYQGNYLAKIFVTKPEDKLLRTKIKNRLEERLEKGMVTEVLNLLESGLERECLERYGLEYRWISLYLHGEIDFVSMKKKLYTDICRFAKRQRTFLRYLQKQGHHLIPIDSSSHLLSEVSNWLK
jgi:tRNA dimethylallyltransferase